MVLRVENSLKVRHIRVENYGIWVSVLTQIGKFRDTGRHWLLNTPSSQVISLRTLPFRIIPLGAGLGKVAARYRPAHPSAGVHSARSACTAAAGGAAHAQSGTRLVYHPPYVCLRHVRLVYTSTPYSPGGVRGRSVAAGWCAVTGSGALRPARGAE